MFIELLAIIISLVVNMRLINRIVKQLFMKIEMSIRCSTKFHENGRSTSRAFVRFARALRASSPRELARAFDAARSELRAQRCVAGDACDRVGHSIDIVPIDMQ